MKSGELAKNQDFRSDLRHYNDSDYCEKDAITSNFNHLSKLKVVKVRDNGLLVVTGTVQVFVDN